MPKEGKTIAKSFRVNEKALQEEAQRQSISVNTLVNQLLIEYAEFGRFLQRVNALRLSRKTFGEVLNSISDDSLAKAAQTAGKGAPIALISSKYGNVTELECCWSGAKNCTFEIVPFRKETTTTKVEV